MKKVYIAHQKGYRITPDGRVFFKNGEEKKLYINPNGYKTFSIKHGRKTVTVEAYRLQAYQKFGMALFEKGVEVRHFNGISIDDSYANIKLGTRSQNAMDIPKKVRTAMAIKASSALRKFSDVKVEEIRAEYHEGKSYKYIMAMFDISPKGSLHYILNNNYQTSI